MQTSSQFRNQAPPLKPKHTKYITFQQCKPICCTRQEVGSVHPLETTLHSLQQIYLRPSIHITLNFKGSWCTLLHISMSKLFKCDLKGSCIGQITPVPAHQRVLCTSRSSSRAIRHARCTIPQCLPLHGTTRLNLEPHQDLYLKSDCLCVIQRLSNPYMYYRRRPELKYACVYYTIRRESHNVISCP